MRRAGNKVAATHGNNEGGKERWSVGTFTRCSRTLAVLRYVCRPIANSLLAMVGPFARTPGRRLGEWEQRLRFRRQCRCSSADVLRCSAPCFLFRSHRPPGVGGSSEVPCCCCCWALPLPRGARRAVLRRPCPRRRRRGRTSHCLPMPTRSIRVTRGVRGLRLGRPRR